MSTLAEEYGAVHYKDDDIIEKIIDMASEKIEVLCDNFDEDSSLTIYTYPVKNTTVPQTVLKIYKNYVDRDDAWKALVAIVDVEIRENIVDFIYYNIGKSKTANAEFINGEMGMVDGVSTPIQIQEFNTNTIDELLDDIYSDFGKPNN